MSQRDSDIDRLRPIITTLGPIPEVRDCPHCGRVGMRAATVCGHCWKKLPPLVEPPQDAA